jgi:LPXTG-motif cell wall-anchored protein
MPAGGPQTGSGSTGGTEEGGLLALGGGLIALAAGGAMWLRRREHDGAVKS